MAFKRLKISITPSFSESCFETNCHVNMIKGTSSKSVPGWNITMFVLLGSFGSTNIEYYNQCRDLGGGTNPNHFWAGYSGNISTTLKGCGNAKVNVGNCYDESSAVLIYRDEVKIGEVLKTSQVEFTFSYKEGSVLRIDNNHALTRFYNFEVTECSPCPGKFYQDINRVASYLRCLNGTLP